MRIVFCSHSHIGPHLVVGSHHLAREFSAMGHSVLHISTPLTPAHLPRKKYAARVQAWRRGVIRHADGVEEIVPLALVPWQIARGFAPELFTTSCPGLRRQISRAGFDAPDLVLVDEPRMEGIARSLAPGTLIYRATDLYGAMRADPSVVEAERRLVARSDGLIGTSDIVLEHLKGLAPSKPYLLVENGVDFSKFSTPAPEPEVYKSCRAPRLLYVGALDHRFDFAAVTEFARKEPGFEIFLAGPADSRADLPTDPPPNLHFIGPVDYENVPALMQHADAGLLPFNDEPSNKGRSPMKLYEYAAAGISVAAHATTELKRRGEPFVHLYNSASEFLPAVRRALCEKRYAAEIRRTSRKHSWTGKAEAVLNFAAAVNPASRVEQSSMARSPVKV